MAKNHIQQGESIDFVAGADLASGAVLLIGELRGVVLDDVANGANGVLGISGVYEVPKDATVAMSAGDPAYWTTDKVDDTNTNPKLGIVVKAELAAATTVKVLLTPAAAEN